MESRYLLAALQILGNLGQVVQSQFQPFGFRTSVGTQFQGVRLGGPLRIDVETSGSETISPLVPSSRIINTGLVSLGQFNGGGFRTIGMQFRDVRVGGGLAVFGADNEDAGLSPTVPVLPTLPNRNVISNSQFNDGGFGTLEARADGSLVTREGRVGLQWLKVRVGGPVDVGLDVDVIQPGARGVSPGPVGALSVPAGDSDPGQTIIDKSTNSGRIQGAQFNDGGFGDIGMQWSKVDVGGRVGTSSNSLFIKPQQDDLGPITVENRVFGRGRGLSSPSGAGVPAGYSSNPPVNVGALATAPDSAFRTTYTNSAANSGRIVRSQFNDGGFGDVGLQWKDVRVGGKVTAVHNSLTVQPENNGQGRITVRGVRFPNAPSASPQPDPGPPRPLAPDPPVIAEDGDPVTSLPKPTGPISPFFPIPFAAPETETIPYPGNYPLVNAVTNSGLIRDGQFSAGGFGDQGLQWKDVRVRGNVRVVHNSLSVHPEGSRLEGISVSDVAYGPPVSPKVARHLAVLKHAVISPGTEAAEVGKDARGGRALSPPNDRALTNQQLAPPSGSDVFLQWNGIDRRRGLVVVHNIIKITGVGPQTGPITLNNIRFPFRVPPLGPLKSSAVRPTVTVVERATASPVGGTPREDQLLNSANNSGIVDHVQFSGGGFGDDGLQWNNVSVGGSVVAVHNTLAVAATADLPAGDVAGPITISGVTFNGGALRGNLSRRGNQVVLSPPDVFQRRSIHPVNPGRALPMNPAVRDDASNSGILAGGQMAAGTATHALLQWQCVRARGKVRVVDNILSISVLDRPSGPITISDVTFA